jgi:hypothetical protein
MVTHCPIWIATIALSLDSRVDAQFQPELDAVSLRVAG